MKNQNKNKDLGVRIKKRLIDLDMTQIELANKLGMNPNYLTQIINGWRTGEKYHDLIIETLELNKKTKY